MIHRRTLRLNRSVRPALQLLLLTTGLLASRPLPAVIFYTTGDPAFNAGAPTGNLAGSGWDLQGQWRSFLGTPIAPNLFLTAKHVGGAAGEWFHFRGTNYLVIDDFADPDSDLHIFKICGIFPGYAGLYTGSDETGRQMVVFGRGTQRGTEVIGDALPGTELKGWKWGPGDGVMRWGENQVATVTQPVAGLGPLLSATFDANAGPNECDLSSGDSGGGIFINDGTGWKLAGINYGVDGPFNTNSTGPGFFAALFDVGGLYQTNDLTGSWEYVQPNPLLKTPASFYATRISAHLSWINSILSRETVTSYVPTLESTPDLNTPFATHSAYTSDELAKTITLSVPATSLFLRLNGCMSHQIVSMEFQGGSWILHYAP